LDREYFKFSFLKTIEKRRGERRDGVKRKKLILKKVQPEGGLHPGKKTSLLAGGTHPK